MSRVHCWACGTDLHEDGIGEAFCDHCEAQYEEEEARAPLVMRRMAEVVAEKQRAEKERDEARAQRDDEAWWHAACLSIAEGAPDWDQPIPNERPAQTAVRRIRQERNAADSLAHQLEARLKAIMEEL